MTIYAAFEASLVDLDRHLPGETRDDGVEGEPVVNPASLSADERRLLLEKIESREVMAVRANIRMFVDRPNLRRVRPEPGRMQELADAAVGTDFMRNHSRAVEDTIGSILSVEIQEFEGDEALIGLHRLTEPSEMAAFVRGERTRFSVAFGADEWTCSQCEGAGLVAPFGTFFSCDCEDAELFGRGALSFLHNAAVSVPAVSGTGVLSLSGKDPGALWADARARGLHPLNAPPVPVVDGGDKKTNPLTLGATPTTQGDTMPEGKTPEQELTELKALMATQKAESDANAAALQVTIDEQQKVHLDSILQAKTATFCIAPAEHESFHKLRESGQMELALSMLELRKPMAATPTQAQGIDQALTAEGGQQSEEATQWSACDAIVGQFALSDRVLTKLKEGKSIISDKLFVRL